MPVNTAQNANRPVNAQEISVLSRTATGTDGWFDISGFRSSTLFFSGLETGSTIKIEVANKPSTPPANGAILTSSLGPDANNCAQFAISGAFHWLRATKTQGTTPTASVGALHGLL